MSNSKQIFSEEQEQEVLRIFREKLLAWLLLFFAILSGTFGVSLWAIKNQVDEIARNSITKEVEKAIQKVQDTAEKQVPVVIQLRKELEEINKKWKDQSPEKLRSDLDELAKRLSNDQSPEELRSDLDHLANTLRTVYMVEHHARVHAGGYDQTNNLKEFQRRLKELEKTNPFTNNVANTALTYAQDVIKDLIQEEDHENVLLPR